MSSPGPRSRGLAAWCGIVAGLVGLSAAHLTAILLDPSASPVVVVGAAVIDLVPPWLKNIAIAVFGMLDKAALLTGIAIVLTLVLGLLGRAAVHRPAVGYAGLTALAVLAASVAGTRPDFRPLHLVPASVAGLVACLSFGLLRARLPGAADDERRIGSANDASRRGFLATLGITAVAAAGAAGLGHLLAGRPRQVADARSALTVPDPVTPAPPAPAGVDPAVDGLTPYLTPAEDFYRIDTALTVPRIDPAQWRLRVFGEVEEEIELTFEQLVAGGLVGAWVTLTCVSNTVGGTLAGNAVWTGVPIRDVLARARPTAGADMVLSQSADGWTASTPLEVLTDPGRAALLAVSMNGEPLPIEHGFPVRMVVPGLYGYVSATKWVTQLEVTRFSRRVAYWSTRGWSPHGPVKTASRVDVPRYGDEVRAGTVAVAGVAWAQHLGVSEVEIQVDEDPWQPAELSPTVGPDTWRQWTWRWQASPGEHRLRVRATDAAGRVQTGDQAPPAPDGATGWHTVQVSVR